MLTDALNSLGYPSSSILSVIILPIADVAAIAEPDIAPNNIDANTFTYAKPPGKLATNDFAKFISLLAIPPRFMISPAKTKNGIASSAKLSIPVVIRCAIVVIPGKLSILSNKLIVVEIPIL